MKYDSLGLPYEDQEGDNSLMLLSLYFINLYFYKKKIDKEFNEKYPVRPRAEDEPFDEYDGYLTARVNAYNNVLAKSGLSFIEECDIHFHHKITGCLYDKKLQTHPIAHYRTVDFRNLATALAALNLYEFDIAKHQDTRNPMLLALVKERKNIAFNAISDLLLSGYCLFGDVDVAGALLIASKQKPSMFTRLAKFMYSFRETSLRLWSEALNG